MTAALPIRQPPALLPEERVARLRTLEAEAREGAVRARLRGAPERGFLDVADACAELARQAEKEQPR